MRAAILLALLAIAGCNGSSPAPAPPPPVTFQQFMIGLFAADPAFAEPSEINDIDFVDQDLEDETLFDSLLR